MQINEALAQNESSHSKLQLQAAAQVERLAATQRTLDARSQDLEEVRQSYQGLAADNRRLQAQVASLQRESTGHQAAVSVAVQELDAVRDAHRAQQLQQEQQEGELQVSWMGMGTIMTVTKRDSN